MTRRDVFTEAQSVKAEWIEWHLSEQCRLACISTELAHEEQVLTYKKNQKILLLQHGCSAVSPNANDEQDKSKRAHALNWSFAQTLARLTAAAW